MSKKSKGHVCFHNGFEFFHGPAGTLYRALESDPLTTHGYRAAAFECTPRKDGHAHYLQTLGAKV